MKLLDPWKDCESFFDIHFADRMSERFLPMEQVKEALRDGEKIMQMKGEYEIRWKKWILSVSMGSCFLYFWTAYTKH